MLSLSSRVPTQLQTPPPFPLLPLPAALPLPLAAGAGKELKIFTAFCEQSQNRRAPTGRNLHDLSEVVAGDGPGAVKGNVLCSLCVCVCVSCAVVSRQQREAGQEEQRHMPKAFPNKYEKHNFMPHKHTPLHTHTYTSSPPLLTCTHTPHTHTLLHSQKININVYLVFSQLLNLSNPRKQISTASCKACHAHSSTAPRQHRHRHLALSTSSSSSSSCSSPRLFAATAAGLALRLSWIKSLVNLSMINDALKTCHYLPHFHTTFLPFLPLLPLLPSYSISPPCLC